MRYIIAPLDMKDDEFKVYKYLWSKCDFKTMICEYTERNILIDIKADFSQKRLRSIFKMFIDMKLFVILEKGIKGKPSKLFINKEVLWNQIGIESESNRNQISIENTNVEELEESNRNQIGIKKVASIKEIKNKENINILIEEVRKNYPGTKTKSAAYKKLPSILKKYSKDELVRCIERYIKFVEDERLKGFKNLQYKNEGTFWNGGYIDYLDENYVKDNTKSIEAKSYYKSL